ncbi:uncharacterized protein LOC106649478 [Trichogramma pretiosum]|uniref:uncharacterized protein LOC106649478 n=1 Tax=Trichogramma pretiosum TaxID=7493 RepID=UPI0006C9DE42|nr:uncharacterized protein LOC106649478 [Trichogramma pretiosum]
MESSESIGRLLLVSILVLRYATSSSGVEKFWRPADAKSNWSNPMNWLEGRRPELSDTASKLVFPREMRHVVGMPRIIDRRLELRGIELADNGQVALPVDGIVGIEDEATKNSSLLSESRWLPDRAYLWMDTANWNGSNEAVPHLERLPCQADRVVLPSSEEIFSISLPLSRSVSVGSVRLADQNRSLPAWRWREIVRDGPEFDVDRRMSRPVDYSQLENCERCRCQAGDLDEYLAELCSLRRAECGPLQCEYPLRVEGHCCPYCGARARLSRRSLGSTARRVARQILARYRDRLAWHLRYTWLDDDGTSEILIREKNAAYEGSDIVIGLAELVAALRDEGVEVLSAESSGAPLSERLLLRALAPVLLWLLLVCAIFVVVCLASGYPISEIYSTTREIGALIFLSSKTKAVGRSVAFARFENIPEPGVRLVEEEKPSKPYLQPKKRAAARRNISMTGGGAGSFFRKSQLDESLSLVSLESSAAVKDQDDDEEENREDFDKVLELS